MAVGFELVRERQQRIVQFARDSASRHKPPPRRAPQTVGSRTPTPASGRLAATCGSRPGAGRSIPHPDPAGCGSGPGPRPRPRIAVRSRSPSVRTSWRTGSWTPWKVTALEEQAIAVVPAVVAQQPVDRLVLADSVAQKGFSHGHRGQQPARALALGRQGLHVRRPLHVRDQDVFAAAAEQSGRQADQLGRPVGHEQLALAGQAKHGLQVVLEARPRRPRRPVRDSGGQGTGEGPCSPSGGNARSTGSNLLRRRAGRSRDRPPGPPGTCGQAGLCPGKVYWPCVHIILRTPRTGIK